MISKSDLRLEYCEAIFEGPVDVYVHGMLRSIQVRCLKVVGYCRTEIKEGVAEIQCVRLPNEDLGEKGNA